MRAMAKGMIAYLHDTLAMTYEDIAQEAGLTKQCIANWRLRNPKHLQRAAFEKLSAAYLAIRDRIPDDDLPKPSKRQKPSHRGRRHNPYRHAPWAKKDVVRGGRT